MRESRPHPFDSITVLPMVTDSLEPLTYVSKVPCGHRHLGTSMTGSLIKIYIQLHFTRAHFTGPSDFMPQNENAL